MQGLKAENCVAMSVDVDDIVFAMKDFRTLESRDYRTTIRAEMKLILVALAKHNAKCTFFVPGYILAIQPDVLDDVLDSGHEVACHANRHCAANTHNAETFEEDLEIAIQLIKKATGVSPKGYRAPGMTLAPVASWAVPILQKWGFEYSSSMPAVASMQHRFQSRGSLPFYWDCGILELPVSSASIAGIKVPVCGSVYSRWLPSPIVRYVTNKFWRSATTPLYYYCHPFELYPENIPYGLFRRWRDRVYLMGCRGYLQKLEWILTNARCITYEESISHLKLPPRGK